MSGKSHFSCEDSFLGVEGCLRKGSAPTRAKSSQALEGSHIVLELHSLLSVLPPHKVSSTYQYLFKYSRYDMNLSNEFNVKNLSSRKEMRPFSKWNFGSH